jgi:hypothetical protein
MIRPSDYGEFALESSSPADPSRAGPHGELDTGWGLRFLKFPYFRDGTLEFIIFFTLFELAHRRCGIGGSTRGELDQGERSSRGFFFKKLWKFCSFRDTTLRFFDFFSFVSSSHPGPAGSVVPRRAPGRARLLGELKPGAGFPVAGLR